MSLFTETGRAAELTFLNDRGIFSAGLGQAIDWGQIPLWTDTLSNERLIETGVAQTGVDPRWFFSEQPVTFVDKAIGFAERHKEILFAVTTGLVLFALFGGRR